MSIRVHELAKHCGLTNKEMMAKLQAMNYPVKSVSSTVDKITAAALEEEYGYKPPVAAPPAVPPPQAPPPSPAPAPTTPPVPAPTPSPAAPPTPAAPAAAPSPPPLTPPPPTPAMVAPSAPLPAAAAAAATATVAPTATVTVTSRQVSAPTVSVAQPRRVVAPPRPTARPVQPAVRAEPTYVVDERGNKVIKMKPPVTVRDLAQRLEAKPHVLLREMMELNIFASLNETIAEDVARRICERHGFLFELERRGRAETLVRPKPPPTPAAAARAADLQPRPPVVTFMGHVDHGKTSLLDAIRKTDVAAHEAGGITQHIGASVVTTPSGETITFLDTPGHEAFTKMRARGANITDIVVLVVAADDGVMPQTLEALNHAKAANVKIIVAINKCDLPAANPDRVRKQLQERGLQPESWGGDVVMVEVSATTKKGIDELLEMILLEAAMLELKAPRQCPAQGRVIEAQIESGMGPTATVLVQRGTLRVGDAFVCGPHYGKVRALINDRGQRVKEAGPSTPVKVVGLSGLPEAGAEFTVVKSEREAREISAERAQAVRPAVAEQRRAPSLEDFLTQAAEGEKKRLKIVLKADVQGSLEALTEALGKEKSDKVELNLIHGAVGNINENDVLLAKASGAIIVGFRVKAESGVTDVAKREGVQIKFYSIIYELLEDIVEAMKGLLEPEARETVLGHAEVRKIFVLSSGAPVAGCVVTDGRITRSGRVRLLRRRAVQYEGRISSLRHFHDDVKEVKSGMECGLRLENFTDYQPGDVIECFAVEKVAAKL